MQSAAVPAPAPGAADCGFGLPESLHPVGRGRRGPIGERNPRSRRCRLWQQRPGAGSPCPAMGPPNPGPIAINVSKSILWPADLTQPVVRGRCGSYCAAPNPVIPQKLCYLSWKITCLTVIVNRSVRREMNWGRHAFGSGKAYRVHIPEQPPAPALGPDIGLRHGGRGWLGPGLDQCRTGRGSNRGQPVDAHDPIGPGPLVVAAEDGVPCSCS